MSVRTHRPSTRRRLFGAMTASVMAASMALGSLPAHATAAQAPEDADLYVAEKGHVDSPKVFFENGQFTLQTEAGGGTRPIDQAIHNLGHGYTRDGDQNFIFTVPANAPELDFLGKPGTNLYMSPMVSNLPHDPIWAGFGADTDVPIEQFRDGAFTLDLISANGPGNVELFRWDPGYQDEPALLTRMLSSSDNDFRSALLTAGTHTHNYTTFSHPGRYELTYRATARTKDGKLLATKEYTTQWQVGGNRPGAAMNSSTTSAPEGSEPSFTIAPASEVAGADAAVQDKLHTLQVHTPAVKEGTAEFTINGFHLATVTLQNGQAGLHEVLPADSTQYQVTVKDAAGQVQYASEPITAQQGKASTASTAADLAPSPATSARFEATESSFDSLSATASITPNDNGTQQLTVKFDDPAFIGFIALDEYSKEGDEYPTVTFDTVTRDGEATIELPNNYLENDGVLKVSVTPHPLMQGVNATRATLTPKLEVGKSYSETFEMKLDGQTPPATASPSPSPTPEEPATCQDRLMIDHGHLDLALQGDSNAVKFAIKDDSRIGAAGSVDRNGDDIALVVPDAAKTKRSPAQTGEVWDAILAPAGEPTWVLPFAQNQSLPWPGYSTERVAKDAFASYKLHLTEVSGPGDVSLFAPNGLGGAPNVLLGSRDGAPRTIDITGPTHAHTGWAFTKPGTYTMTFSYDAIRADGSKVSSNPQTVTLVVGDQAKDAYCKTASEPQTPTAPPQPTGTGTPAPTPLPERPTDTAVPTDAEATPPHGTEATDSETAGAVTATPAATDNATATPVTPSAGALATTGGNPWPLFGGALGVAAIGLVLVRRQSEAG